MKFRNTGNTYYERKQISYHHHQNLFMGNLKANAYIYSFHPQKVTQSSCYEGRPLSGQSNPSFFFVIVYIDKLHLGFKTNHFPQNSKNRHQLQRRSNVQQLYSYFLGDVIIKKLTYLIRPLYFLLALLQTLYEISLLI